jgi:hypothetical protein
MLSLINLSPQELLPIHKIAVERAVDLRRVKLTGSSFTRGLLRHASKIFGICGRKLVRKGSRSLPNG